MKTLKEMVSPQYASLLYALAAMGVQRGNALLRDAIAESLKHHAPFFTIREFVKVLESLRPVSAPCIAAVIVKEVHNRVKTLRLPSTAPGPVDLTIFELMSLIESLRIHKLHRFDSCVCQLRLVAKPWTA